MTIYLITELYPADENDISITHAVRNFADNWNEEVIVFCPLGIGISTIRNWKKYIQLIKDPHRQVNGRRMVFFPLLKIPFIRKYYYLINHRSTLPPPNVIAGHCIKGNHIAYAMSKRYGLAFSAGMHNHDIDVLQKERRQYSKVLAASSLIVCRSYNIRRRLNELTGQKYEKQTFIANSGIEAEQIEEQVLFKKKANSLGKREAVLITAAHLRQGKNIDVTIEVLSDLRRPFTYTIIGEGPERQALQGLIDQHGLSGKISILGWKKRSEVLDYFRESDIFIMASAPETFGLTYLEAMAKGCIIVGAYGHGIDGVIQNGKNGFLVEPGKKDALEKVLEEIFTLSEKQREDLAARSRKTILELTELKVADAYLAKLKEIASK